MKYYQPLLILTSISLNSLWPPIQVMMWSNKRGLKTTSDNSGDACKKLDEMEVFVWTNM